MATKPKDVPRQIQKIIKQEVNGITLKARRTDLSNMGRAIIRAMKESISKGKSTIRGKGPFPIYKDSYKKVIRRGTGDFKNKRVSPVNLKVSGDFIKALVFKLRRGTKFPTLRIGYFEKSELQKERGHRAGHNKQRNSHSTVLG